MLDFKEKPMRSTGIVVGGIALAHTIFWLVTGMTLTMPIQSCDLGPNIICPDAGRGLILFLMHIAALFWGGTSIAYWNDPYL